MGTRASRLLNLDQFSSSALALDLACTKRLLDFENEKERLRLKAQRIIFKQAMKEAIAETLFNAQPPSDDDEDDESETQPSEDDVL
jgi:hypothetical protein